MTGINIMFLCYWGINDGLTQSTALPHLKELKQRIEVDEIIFVTIEREAAYLPAENGVEGGSITHIPLAAKNVGINLVTKITDFIHLPRQILSICKKRNIRSIFAHGAPAGALAYKVSKQYNCPVYISLFEPHADYMMDSGVWSRYSLKYLFQSYWERMLLKNAVGLMPVTVNYKMRLLKKGVPGDKVFTVPCTVDASDFKFKGNERTKFRDELGWQDDVVGIYVGKFGGLYYDAEAFQIFRRCIDLISHFRLIVLSPQAKKVVESQFIAHGIDMNIIHLDSVDHKEVPDYLSAADFAFATYKPGPYKKYLSPVKVGEYWANGLPVLMTEGIGDDSDIIKNEGGGALFNLKEEGSLERAIEKIQQILRDPAHRQEIPKLAVKYRSPDRIREAYEYFFQNSAANS